jgi:hypothetical protein
MKKLEWVVSGVERKSHTITSVKEHAGGPTCRASAQEGREEVADYAVFMGA